MEAKIASYLEGKFPGMNDVKVTRLKKMTEGFSYQTIMFSVAWREKSGQHRKDLVLRMEPADPIALGPCSLEAQFAILKALQKSTVPAPPPLCVEPDASVLGTPFMIVERVRGEVPISWGEGLDEATRVRIKDQFVDINARIHRVDWQGLGLTFMLGAETPDTCDVVTREINRWEKVVNELSVRPEPILNEALLWCRDNKPVPKKLSLVHGDYRMGNFIWHNNKIRAMLDWEIASIGDPMCDLGWTSLRCWRGEDPRLISGLVERSQFYELYEKYSGMRVDPDHVFFWEVLGNVHMACILIQNMYGFEKGRINDLRCMVMEQNMFRPILKELTDMLEF